MNSENKNDVLTYLNNYYSKKFCYPNKIKFILSSSMK